MNRKEWVVIGRPLGGRKMRLKMARISHKNGIFLLRYAAVAGITRDGIVAGF